MFLTAKAASLVVKTVFLAQVLLIVLYAKMVIMVLIVCHVINLVKLVSTV